MKRILMLLATTLFPMPLAAEGEVVALADAIVRMTSTNTWTPRKFRGTVGELRAISHASSVWHESNKAGIDPYLVAAIVANESGFDMASSGKHGEIGWMQVLPKGFAVSKLCQDERNALKEIQPNLRCGIKELKHMIEKCGTVESALSAYNTGYCESSVGAKYAERVLAKMRQGQGVRIGNNGTIAQSD